MEQLVSAFAGQVKREAAKTFGVMEQASAVSDVYESICCFLYLGRTGPCFHGEDTWTSASLPVSKPVNAASISSMRLDIGPRPLTGATELFSAEAPALALSEASRRPHGLSLAQCPVR